MPFYSRNVKTGAWTTCGATAVLALRAASSRPGSALCCAKPVASVGRRCAPRLRLGWADEASAPPTVAFGVRTDGVGCRSRVAADADADADARMRMRTAACSYEDIVKKHQPPPEADEVAADDGTVEYFNGVATISKKVDYAFEKRIGGVMIWEGGQVALSLRAQSSACIRMRKFPHAEKFPRSEVSACGEEACTEGSGCNHAKVQWRQQCNGVHHATEERTVVTACNNTTTCSNETGCNDASALEQFHAAYRLACPGLPAGRGRASGAAEGASCRDMPDAVILSPWRNIQAHRCQRQRRAGALARVTCQCAFYKFPPG